MKNNPVVKGSADSLILPLKWPVVVSWASDWCDVLPLGEPGDLCISCSVSLEDACIASGLSDVLSSVAPKMNETA